MDILKKIVLFFVAIGMLTSFSWLKDDDFYSRKAVNLTYEGLHSSDQVQDTIKRSWKDYINLDMYNRPFWKTDTVVDESVQLIRNGDTAIATLLFKAKKILSVKSGNFKTVFKKGLDWNYKNGKLTFPSSSAVPFFNYTDLVFDKKKAGQSMGGKIPGTYVLFSEGAYFSSKQIVVTYIKDKSSTWNGPVPVFASSSLPLTISRLKNRDDLKILFYGNSIEVGFNASGLENVAPYMPVWPELIVHNLKQSYKSRVAYVNKSVAGRLASWGLDSVLTKVVPEKPDLVIIGFGMNDGTRKIAPSVYREQIKGIIDTLTKHQPSVEFILISPMLANPASDFSGLQSLYKNELNKLARKGVVVADLTGVHEELLKHKTYQDMTGNNVNHPNDYLARWYAQMISGLLINR